MNLQLVGNASSQHSRSLVAHRFYALHANTGLKVLHGPRRRQACHALDVQVTPADQQSWLSSAGALDLLYARTPNGSTETLQVISASEGGETLTVGWKGQVLQLRTAPSETPGNGGGWTAEQVGNYPAETSALAAAFPALLQGGLLQRLHDHAGAAPASLSSLEPVYTLAELEAAAAADATLWCEGTRPGAPEKTPLQSQTLTAGELVALMQGKRGVVIVQLWNGFDPGRGQPLYDPWVVHLLEAALATPGLRAVPSVAPGGVGLTAVLFADKEPWSTWGPHLASFGCQANAVAGSAYYKVLIGKILGYSDENIYGYVRSVGGGLTPAVIAQVEADLKKLSKAKPKLPWNREGSRGAKKAAAAPQPAQGGRAGGPAAGAGRAGAPPSGGGRRRTSGRKG